MDINKNNNVLPFNSIYQRFLLIFRKKEFFILF